MLILKNLQFFFIFTHTIEEWQHVPPRRTHDDVMHALVLDVVDARMWEDDVETDLAEQGVWWAGLHAISVQLDRENQQKM